MPNVLEFFVADSVPLEIVVTQNGMPIDITGYMLFFAIKNDADDTDENAKTFRVLTEFTDPEHGMTLLLLDKGDTDMEPKNDMVYAFKLVDADGNPVTFEIGRCNALRNPIRATTNPDEAVS
jgi:hypothetical protein